ncbi:MAG: Fe-S cluster assembly sulfur transfer protein SufU [Burkholderiales bacterium]
MADLTQLYDDVMMDHIKNARNYRELPDATQTVEAVNVLCGDKLTLYVSVDAEERISDIAFQCSCCGVSMASASMMTSVVKGKRKSEAKALYDELISVVTNCVETDDAALTEAQQVVVLTTRNVPSRKNCAVLAWHALNTALDGREQQVSVG